MIFPLKLRNLVLALALAFPLVAHAEAPPVRALIVVAHPDDEYCFAATIYRLTHELGASADQVVITNGESGFRYSGPAEKVYGRAISREAVGKRELPAIRRHELEASGKVLGIGKHVFLDQPDAGKIDDVSQSLAGWDVAKVGARLDSVLRKGKYDFVFTLLPIAPTHGHHKAATVLALDAVGRLPEGQRPAVLGCWTENHRHPPHDPDQLAETQAAKDFRELAGRPETRVADPVVLSFDREAPFGPEGKLSYQIFVNWMIAAHKSQGLFQTFVLRDDTENFDSYALNSPEATERARALFRQISRGP